MWIVLYSLIILSSIIILPVGESYWMPKNAVFIILGLIFIFSSWLTRPKERTIFYSPWISYLGIAFALHLGFFFLKPLVFNDARGNIVWNMWMVLPILNFFIGIIMVQTLVEYTDKFERWINIAKAITYLGFVLSTYAILQFFKLDQIFQYTKKLHGNTVCMFFGNPMLAGNYLAIISPLALMFRQNKFRFIYVIMGIATFLTDSQASIAIFIFGFFLYLLLTGRREWAVVILLFSLSFVLWKYFNNPSYFTLSRRLILWKGTLGFIKEAPYTGFGLGYFITRQFYADPNIVSWAHTAHNEILEIAHDCGIFFAFGVLCYVFSLFKRLFYIFLSEGSMLLICFGIGFINYLLIAQVGFPLRIAPLALIGILYIACLEVHCSQARKIGG